MSDAILDSAVNTGVGESSGGIYDLLVIGAGPTGLACAIDAQNAGFRVVLVDKGCVCNSLYHYPSHMTFFTTPELLEIGNIPFPSPNPKPNRNEALQYYRQVAAHYRLDIRQYQTVERVTGSDGDFYVHIRDRFDRVGGIQARKLVVATGYYDLPNYLRIPGEGLSKVMHYYDDPHPYSGLDVVVIGGKNSAAIAALGFDSVTIFRPSFLTGERIGAPTRRGEHLAVTVLKFGNLLLPKKYQSISGQAVARSMVQSLQQTSRGVRIVESGEMQKNR